MEPQMPVTSPFDTPSQPTMPTMPVSSPSTTPQPSFTQSTPTPAPAFALKMEPERDTQMTTTTTVQTVEAPKKKGIGYPLIGLMTIIAGIVLVAEQYGLGNLLPYPLSGLIAAGLVILVGLWLLAKGWLGRIIAFWLGLALVAVIGGMIYDTLYPGTLPRSGSRGITVGYDYDQPAKSLTLTLGTLPFSGSDQVIVPPTPLDETSIDTLIDDGLEIPSSGESSDLEGYTITVTGANTSGTKN